MFSTCRGCSRVGVRRDHHARPFEPQSKVILEDFVSFWRLMPTKWFQERADGSKNELGIGFEGPGVVSVRREHLGRFAGPAS